MDVTAGRTQRRQAILIGGCHLGAYLDLPMEDSGRGLISFYCEFVLFVLHRVRKCSVSFLALKSVEVR